MHRSIVIVVTHDWYYNAKARSLAEQSLALTLNLFLTANVIGVEIADLQLVWFTNTDLIGTYLRALSFLVDGTPDSTSALGFPGQVQTGLWGTFQFDGLITGFQFLLGKLKVLPALSTSLFIFSSISLTSISTVLLLRKLGLHPLLRLAGSLSLCLLPYTMLRPYHPTYIFVWPYVLTIIIALGSTGVVSFRTRTLFISGFGIAISGAYSFLYSAIALSFVWSCLWVLRPGIAPDRKRRIVLTVAGTASGIAICIMTLFVWPSSLQNTNINQIRPPSEAPNWQGWPVSLFVPGPFSGIPFIGHQLEVLNASLYIPIDSSTFCPDEWEIHNLAEKWSCLRLVDSLAFNSLTSFLGNWMALYLVLGLIVSFNFSARHMSKLVHVLSPSTRGALVVLCIVWCSVLLTNAFGFGLLVARVFPGARNWGRMYQLALVCSSILILLVIHDVTKMILEKSQRSLFFLLVLMLVLVDQALYSHDSLASNRFAQASYLQFGEQLVDQYSPGCAIVQFPSRSFAPTLSRVTADYTTYSDFSLAMYAPQFRWTAGALIDESEEPWPILRNPFSSEIERHIYFERLVRSSIANSVCGIVVDKSEGSGVSYWDESFLEFELQKAGVVFSTAKFKFLTSFKFDELSQTHEYHPTSVDEAKFR